MSTNFLTFPQADIAQKSRSQAPSPQVPLPPFQFLNLTKPLFLLL